MDVSTTRHSVPYYSQWESASLVPEFLAGLDAGDDPLWQKSGADNPHEYAFWARRMCGVACLRMVLAFWGHQVPPSVPLVRELSEAGAYVRNGDTVRGLIYQPFAEHVKARWGLDARSVPDLPPERIPAAIASGRLALLSVHPTIRTPELPPPGKGGHLVLAVGAGEEGVIIHNPSGLPGDSQEYATVAWEHLDTFYARRGVIIGE
ncbi:C39 family peptidase [Streptomyces malaysiensis]|uniref:C39 family peptidase n=1 Tax=Streptomyces malaysiensis subsp. samsunensis TaxID=459658 RepID=A0A9X2RV44_STRMQ|nr:C39 family peptidase [Streptomyces samsunensis]MCQ8831912.1 C39 family peptidase [Streptomyces samsunensis]